MRISKRIKKWRYGLVAVVGCAVLAWAGGSGLTSTVYAQGDKREALAPDQRIITIFDQGERKVIVTRAETVARALERAEIPISEGDMVEPSLDSEFTAREYTVNIYRAKPVMVVDGMRRERILSPYSSAKDIVKHASIKTHSEDTLKLEQSQDLLNDGIGSRLTITRATPVNLVLYGERTKVRTQATTVAGLLQDKKIELGPDDTISVAKTAAIERNMTIEIWRNGVQTITETQPVDFPVEQIEDADRPIGYREVKTPGVKGEKNVTYEVTMKNGQEVDRKEIQSVVTKQPEKEVVIVGAKPNFDGDFAAALAKLRSCEGGYNSYNPAGPYYGAYQFDQQTWQSVSSAPYGNASPAEQDAAARALYERRGWQPWPVCGSGLPDTFR